MPTLNVTLDQTTNPWSLSVSEANNVNEIPRSSVAQTITWQLSGNAASGTFNAANNPDGPGFAWIGTQPPRGVFINPQLQGSQFSLSDLNNSSATAGTWTYQLCATIGGTTYKTIASPGISGTNTNPKIKNKS